MKITTLLLSLGALLAFSGCNNLASPESTVASAYSDVQGGKLDDFQGTLSGTALSQYGTQAGMGELQKKLDGTSPQIGEVKKISENANQDGSGWTAVYDVTVVAKDSSQALLDLGVTCNTTQDGTPGSCIGNNPTDCPTGSSTYTTFCSIDSID